MAKSYIDGCICGKLPVNRSDVKPDCPLHGPLLAIWPEVGPSAGESLNQVLSNNIQDIDPRVARRLEDPEWLRRAADYLDQSNQKSIGRALSERLW
jgi:hypothetical protein